jgi:hypothetical protein
VCSFITTAAFAFTIAATFAFTSTTESSATKHKSTRVQLINYKFFLSDGRPLGVHNIRFVPIWLRFRTFCCCSHSRRQQRHRYLRKRKLTANKFDLQFRMFLFWAHTTMCSNFHVNWLPHLPRQTV